LIIIIAEA